MSSVRYRRGRSVGKKGWEEHGKLHCYSQGLGLSPISQGSYGKAYPGARCYDLCLRQFPLASVWDVRGGRVEARSPGKKG